jgi:methyltransferase
MMAAAFALAVIAGLMLAELRVSRAHERRLRQAGAVEPPDDVYTLMAILYPAAFLIMGAEGLWRAAASEAAAAQTAVAAARANGPAWPVSGVLLFAASKALKYWAIATLGPRWSFRVLVLPGRPLVRTGPYRYVAHPNYIGVIGELVGTAMMVGARLSGPIMTALFGLVLWARIRVEERAHASAAAPRAPAGKE